MTDATADLAIPSASATTIGATTTAQKLATLPAHLAIPVRAARMFYGRLRNHFSLTELIAFGNLGLMEAAQRYDATRGASFATFAWYRVKGSIIDNVRRFTALPRRVWRQLLALRNASEILEEQERLAATQAREPAEHASDIERIKAKLAAVKASIAAVRTVYFVSYDESCETIADEDRPAYDAIDRARAAKHLAKALAQLPWVERELIEKHYHEGKNLLEAGRELHRSKTWASRTHARAIERLRDVLDHELARAA